MEKHIPKLSPSRFITLGLCLLFALVANHARAARYYWDPEGNMGTASSVYTYGSLAGNWEDASWSTNDFGQDPPINIVEGSDVVFGVGVGATNYGDPLSTTAFTVNMNSDHTVTGIFDGWFNPNSCIVTLQGPGRLIVNNVAGFPIINSSDKSLGQVIINNVVAGTGNIVPESGGSTGGILALNGVNTISGGVDLGYGSTTWNGTVSFNNVGSFGTGPISLRNSSGNSTLLYTGAGAMTITNSFIVRGNSSLNLSGNAAGLTSSGPWNLSTYSLTLGAGGSGNVVTLSGVISGTGKLTKGINSGSVLELTGANTFSGPVTNSSGTLRVNSIADSGSSALGVGPNVTMNGGTLSYSGASPVTTSRAFYGVNGKTSTIDLPAGSLTINNAFKAAPNGAFTINKTGSATLTLGGTTDNSYLGMNVNGGTVILNKASTASVHGLGTSSSVGSGGTLQLAGTGAYQIYSGVTLTVNSGGLFDANGQTNAFAGLKLAGTGISSGGALVNSSAGTAAYLTAPVTLTAASSIGGSGNILLDGGISGAYPLTYVGTGILTLSNINTYSGGTLVNSGTLEVVGSIACSVTNGSAGVLQLDNAAALAGTATLALPATPNAGSVNLNFSGTNTIVALMFGSTAAAQGTWGAVDNPNVQYQNAAFTGSGVLNVTCAPQIVQNPQSMFTYIGGAAGFSVSAVGSPPLSYQWSLNGSPITGANGPSYNLSHAQLADAGTYACTIMNSYGSAISSNVVLTVINQTNTDGYATAIMNDSPLAYWRLDETNGTVAHDVVGGYNGQYNSVALNQPGFSPIDPDPAAGFGPGPNSYVGSIQGITFEAVNNLTTFSLEAWVKSTNSSQANGAAIITKGAGGGGEQFNLDVYQGVYRFFVRDTTGATVGASASVGPTNGVWQHVVAVYDGPNNYLYIYVNGQQVGYQTASTNGILASSHEISIGARQSGNTAYDNNFKGIIDEVAIYATALDGGKIWTHYNAQYNWPGFGPIIARQPQSVGPVFPEPNTTVSFNVMAGGDQSFTYQWMFNGSPIPGANDSTYTLSGVASNNAGIYSCAITNYFGWTNSLGATLTVLGTDAYADAVLADGPIAFWRLDETSGNIAYDYWGGHNGNYTNAFLGQPGFSILYSNETSIGLSTNGSGSYMSTDYTPFDFYPTKTSFTLETWAYFTNWNGNAVERLFSTWANSVKCGYGFGIVAPNALLFTTYGIQDFNLPLTNALVLNQWYHLAAASDSSYIYFYVNGQPVGQVAYNGQPLGLAASSRPMILGRNNADPAYSSHGEQVSGRMAQAAIFGKTLSAPQILAHWNASQPPIPIPAPPIAIPPTNYVGLTTIIQENAMGVGLSYQWYKESTPLTGQNDSTLTLANLQLSDAGSYWVRVSNSGGSSNSTAVAVTVLPVPTQPTDLSLTNGLVLHLPFDSDYSDISGRRNNGTNVGNTTLVSGMVGANALSYSTDTNTASFNYVTLGVRPDLQFSSNVDFSVSYWVKLPFYAAPGYLPFFGNASNSLGNVGFAFAPAGYGAWGWSFLDSTGHSVFRRGDDYSINDGNWHHLVHTFNRTSVGSTYLDGVQVNAQSDSYIGNIDTGNPFTIGQDPSGVYPVSASANLDDLGIWRRVLTPLEISGIYVAGSVNHVTFAPVVVAPIVPVSLQLQQVAGQWQITWTGSDGALQASGDVAGTYTNVPSATSPYIVPMSPASQMFYRLKY